MVVASAGIRLGIPIQPMVRGVKRARFVNLSIVARLALDLLIATVTGKDRR